MTEPTLTQLAANTTIKLAKVPLDAGIDAAKKTIEILTGVNKQMDISGATQELQARLDTLAGAMKNQSTQLKAGETSAEFMELLAAAIQAANEVGSEIGPPLAAEAQKIIIKLFKFGKSTAADLIGLIPVVGEVFDVLRIINSVVSTGISSVDSFVTSADLLMDGFDKFVDKMSGVLTESDSELLTTESYNELLESDRFKKEFGKKFPKQKPPLDLQALEQNQDIKNYVIKFLQARKQFTGELQTSKTRTKLLQGYANKRLQHHTKNISSLKEQVQSQGIVPLVKNQTTSGLSKIHQNVSDAAKDHYTSLQEAIKKRSTERQERQA
jgi:hypothetical protein